ncbi:AP-5 complex subunit beta-1-like isoform X2 [Stegodyphus dumicola]|nr:AP-5 complex subunit beta-1-like isoform X2 [Stegodyphus dumicola]
MYSIVITAQSTPLCKEISEIEIPVLKGDKGQETLINLRFIPLEPHPLTLYFRAEFTCSNGYTYNCHLQPVILKFEDAFLPLPVPKHLDCSVSLWRHNLFNELWDRFLEESKSTHIKEVRYCQSAFCFDVKKDDLPSIVEERWKPFIIEKLPNTLYAIAIFLPPRNHLLMKISIVNEKPFINILVDSILILPWANVYLQEITHTTGI